jgi:hypothetical protein
MIDFLPRPALLLLLLVTALAGCGDSVQSNPTSFSPSGRWRYVERSVSGGDSLRSYLFLDPTRGIGVISDTITRGGVDSVVDIRLEYTTVGDGYQRMLLIRQDSGAVADTTLGYWYFFRSGDTLLYYSGMRYLGSSARLKGAWGTDPADIYLVNERCRLEFGEDSVRVHHEDLAGGVTSETLRYTTNGDNLQVEGNSCIAGDRFEVTPGVSLYITSRTTRRYRPLQ